MPKVLLMAIMTWSVTLRSQTFVKITDSTNPITTSEASTNGYVGASWIDFNNDGRLDLFANRLYLYRNDGSGAFTKIASGIGANQTQTIGSGNSWADYDNDGDLDCFYSGGTSRLYRNNGDGTFTPITTGEIGDSLATRGWACAWADYDHDGNVDLIITHPAGFVGQMPPTPNHLFHNDGPPNYTFTRVTAGEFVTALAPYTVATWSDYDNDGDIDLFIGSGPANGNFAPDYLYRNMLKETGAANFERITTAPIATDLVDGQVWNWIDYDNDGDLDAFLTNYGASQTTNGLANNLYRNDNGIFTRMTGAQVGSIVTTVDASLASVWGDFDNDGDLDVLVTQEQGRSRRYYRNNGDGTFTSAGTGDFVAGTNRHASATAGDYDNDGDLDIYVTGASATKALFRNDLTNGNSWINILCIGTASNRSAIGAKVRAKATIDGKAIWQLREISSQNTFNGQSMLNAHFGFGNATLIDSLKIEWPSGNVEVASNVPVNRFIIVTEGSGIPTGVKENSSPLPADFALSQSYPNPLQTSAFNSATTITYTLPKSTQVVLSVYNVLGQRLVTLVNRAQEAGSHTATWDGKDAKGEILPSGIYLYKIETDSFTQTKKLILAK
ncbi:FG-GAP-like repeat-containing protein [candidate division KSB1 bacterium]|nr:FG-GAP-like repeat-containing protein [candidate division KSB1 bacterium]